MRTFVWSSRVVLLALLLVTGPAVAHGRPAGRVAQAPGSERIVSTPFTAGGYPGAKPAPGACIAAPYDANFSESVLAAQRVRAARRRREGVLQRVVDVQRPTTPRRSSSAARRRVRARTSSTASIASRPGHRRCRRHGRT